MDTTFKFRFVNEITGVFVLLAVALLAVGIFMAGNAQGLFEKKFKLHVVFTSAEGSFGLKKGSEIKILATPAGAVDQIEPTSDGAIKAIFMIKERYHGFVRTSSRAVVKKTLVITGDAYVEISVGDRKDLLIPDGGSIDCVKDTEIIEQASAMLEEIRAKAIPSLEKLQLVLNELPGLTTQARKTLHQGEVLMRDDLPGLTAQTQDTLREVQILIRGLERHWLLRKYIEPLDSGPMIDPSQTGPLRGEMP
ncbi:MAG: MCE family protein [Verrucomicrobia bacterium]|nr:MCE family protein [Verrucomicrobiota bacterium]MCG2680250.1 MlaD family protein [Kiritimatiellia bacterium]MBU4248548.1 MCE family protein [Verrucomicrobiota bacterium]MBU4289785.1 MCE family protein [Verrucomicrobiota bacterium]MBU4429593.1 MCE family protein [Verrucomicrobiota bacterium]